MTIRLDAKAIQLKLDDNYKSGFGCDAKWVGTALENILDHMRVNNFYIPPHLEELKNHLRHKGNSKRASGDFSLWKDEDEEIIFGENKGAKA